MENEKSKLEKEIKELEEQLKDREAALPAHSVRPHQLQVIEDLEEKIREKKRELEKSGAG
jgi:archaellum component FlaC